MTYNVIGGTLSLTQSINQSIYYLRCLVGPQIFISYSDFKQLKFCSDVIQMKFL